MEREARVSAQASGGQADDLAQLAETTHYERLFRDSPAVFLLINADTTEIVDANAAACAFYGYAREDLTRLKVTDINPASRETVLHNVALVRSGSQGHFLLQHRLASGEVRDVEVYSGPITLAGRQFLYSIVHDVTDRTRAEEALRQSEARYKALVESIPAVTYIASPKGLWDPVYFSPQIEELTGYPPETWMTDQNLFEQRLHPQDRARTIEAVDRFHSGNREHYDQSYRLVSRDGREVWYRDQAVMVHADDGTPLCIQGVMLDVTAAKQAEEELLQYKQAVEASEDLIAVFDRDYRICLINDAGLRSIGSRREDVLGRSLVELVGEDSFTRQHKRYLDPCFQGESVRVEMVVRHPGMGERDMQVSCYPLPGPDGVVAKIVTVARDVTAQTQFERERQITVRLLQEVNRPGDVRGLVQSVATLLQEYSGCEAVGVRLRDGDDFPYFETRGFPPQFVEVERGLCFREKDGTPMLGAMGNPLLACLCGAVVSGATDGGKPYFTSRGSFWSNCTSDLLASVPAAELAPHLRGRCNAAGYESVALIPLRAEEQTLGLLQLNDRRRGCFTLSRISFLETLSEALAIALAQRIGQSSPQPLPGRSQLLEDGTSDVYYRFRVWPRLECEFVSASCVAMSGYEPQELISKPDLALSVVHPDDLPVVMRMIRSARASSDPLLLRVLPKGGGTIWVEHRGVTIFDDSDRVLAVEGLLRNVTERKHAEDALEESRQREDAIVRSVPAVIFVTRPAAPFALTWAGDSIHRLTGYDRDQATAEAGFWSARLHPEERARALRRYEAVLARGSVAFEARWQHADGSYRRYRIQAVLQRDASGSPKEIVASMLDLSHPHQPAGGGADASQTLPSSDRSSGWTHVNLVLPPLEVVPARRPTSCPHCGSQILQRHQARSKAVKDNVEGERVEVVRYRCADCHRTFGHYPSGIGRGSQSQRLRLATGILYGLGLSSIDIGRVLAEAGLALSATTIWRNSRGEGRAMREARPPGVKCILAHEASPRGSDFVMVDRLHAPAEGNERPVLKLTVWEKRGMILPWLRQRLESLGVTVEVSATR